MTTIMKNLSRPNRTNNDTNYKFITITKAISNLSHVISSKLASLVSTINNKLSITGGAMDGEIDMNNKNIINLASPINHSDAANKNYVDTITHNYSGNNINLFLSKNRNDTSYHIVIEIAEILYLELKYSDINTTYIFQKFSSCYLFLYKLIRLYNEIFDTATHNQTLERLNSNTPYIDDLKFNIITLIESLGEGHFIGVKKTFISRNLAKTPDNGTDQKKLRKLLNKASRNNTQQVELLVQKNLLIIDLGFIYLNTELLNSLLEFS